MVLIEEKNLTSLDLKINLMKRRLDVVDEQGGATGQDMMQLATLVRRGMSHHPHRLFMGIENTTNEELLYLYWKT